MEELYTKDIDPKPGERRPKAETLQFLLRYSKATAGLKTGFTAGWLVKN